MLTVHRITARSVAEFVASRNGLSMAVFTSPQVGRGVARARQTAMYAIREICPHASLTQIGRVLGGRDHTTILHGVRKIESLLATDEKVRGDVEAALEHFRSLPPQPIDLMLSAQIDATSKHLEALILEARTRVAQARMATA